MKLTIPEIIMLQTLLEHERDKNFELSKSSNETIAELSSKELKKIDSILEKLKYDLLKL